MQMRGPFCFEIIFFRSGIEPGADKIISPQCNQNKTSNVALIGCKSVGRNRIAAHSRCILAKPHLEDCS
jgi:hypothetical protein